MEERIPQPITCDLRGGPWDGQVANVADNVDSFEMIDFSNQTRHTYFKYCPVMKADPAPRLLYYIFYHQSLRDLDKQLNP